MTGATGLVGRALCSSLNETGIPVLKAVRESCETNEFAVGEIHGNTGWGEVLSLGVDTVVHLAAHVPTMRDRSASGTLRFWQTNTLGTENLARQCAEKQVKRLVFVSTAKVLDEDFVIARHLNSPLNSADAYALSKWEAEQRLWEIAAESTMEIVVLRPPLVYGPRVKGNFLNLMRAVNRGYPLPLGSIANCRSLIYLENLVDAIKLCLWHPAAVGRSFVVSDGEDVSSPELVRRLAVALGVTPRLLNVPTGLIRLLGRLLGKRAAVDRLLGSLVLDTSVIRQELGWQPPFTMKVGLAATAAWYQNNRACH